MLSGWSWPRRLSIVALGAMYIEVEPVFNGYEESFEAVFTIERRK